MYPLPYFATCTDLPFSSLDALDNSNEDRQNIDYIHILNVLLGFSFAQLATHLSSHSIG